MSGITGNPVEDASRFARQTGHRFGRPRIRRGHNGLTIGRVQFVWWGRWIGVRNIGPWPESTPLKVYTFRMALGIIEIRRFAT
jgi:hypothetical protein